MLSLEELEMKGSKEEKLALSSCLRISLRHIVSF